MISEDVVDLSTATLCGPVPGSQPAGGFQRALARAGLITRIGVCAQWRGVVVVYDIADLYRANAVVERRMRRLPRDQFFKMRLLDKVVACLADVMQGLKGLDEQRNDSITR
jgi:hypothetical protein